MKTLSTVLREENITKRADILKFVRNSKLVKVKGGAEVDSEKATFQWHDSNARFNNISGSSIYASELYVVTDGENTVECFEEKLKQFDTKIKAIEKEKEKVKNKINFLKESGAEKFTENEYRAYQAIQTINKENLTDFEKAKIISDLIK